MSRRPSGHGLLTESKGARSRASSSLLAGETDCVFLEWYPERNIAGEIDHVFLVRQPL
ncbi:hypothetical protein JW879_10610 [candidate division WOR-3 bacterium]|nr:hypothetical protein [candidate division WOR-3 bacterium]